MSIAVTESVLGRKNEQAWQTQNVIERDAEHIMGTYKRLPVVLVRGSGTRVWDSNGKEYLDFVAGIAVNGLGHCHPRVVAAIQEQAGIMIHASNLYYTQPQVALATRLCELSDFEKVFFCNSGAEANETAIKIARKRGKLYSPDKFKIVTATGSFHGRTLATVTATAQPKYQEPFAPLVPGFYYTRFNDVAALEALVDDNTCAVMLEPVQGEGGVHPATREYLEAARRCCDKHNALLIYDEVQTGLGRTGYWWAYQQFGIVPDVMTLAKSLGAGVPIGACLARGAAAGALIPGDHGSTFAGNPLAASAALAVLETIEAQDLVAHAAAMGTYLVDTLKTCSVSSEFSQIRSAGLMVGIDLAAPRAREVVNAALSLGLIVNATSETTIRLLPPLVVTPQDVDEAVGILQSAV